MQPMRMGALWHVAIVLLASWFLHTQAAACGYVPEETLMRNYDAVVDGVAICDLASGKCRIRPTEILKDNRALGIEPIAYSVTFEPGAVKRYFEADTWNICWVPWEPEQQVTKGRFYLNKLRHGYEVHRFRGSNENAGL